MKYFKFKYLFFVSLLFCVVLANTAYAHRVVVFAWIDGDTVFTESQFPDGKRVGNGDMTVYDLSGNTLLNGKTNANGEFSFKILLPVGMRIVLKAGMGHQGEWTLSDAEVAGSDKLSDPAEVKTPADKPPEQTDILSQNQSDIASFPQSTQPDLSAGVLNEKQVEQIVDRVLDKKLKPVTQMLVQLRQPGPTLSDIFGGIGYILGLMGVAMYFMSKKKKP